MSWPSMVVAIEDPSDDVWVPPWPADRGGPARAGRVAPSAKVAILAEADFTGRRRARWARARPTDGFFDDLAPGDYVVHQHGVARYTGMVTRVPSTGRHGTTSCSSTGATTSSTCLRTRSTSSPTGGGDSPTLQRLGGRSGSGISGQGPGRRARDRPGARRALPVAFARATPSRPTRPGNVSSRTPSPSPRPSTNCCAPSEEVKTDMESHPHGTVGLW